MWFAAKEAYERRLAERKRREGLSEGYRGGIRASYREGLRQGREEIREKGRQEGRQEERERISRMLAEHGVTLPAEVARILSDGSDLGR